MSVRATGRSATVRPAAVRPDAIRASAVRPSVGQWLGYAIRGRLPDRFREWVLNDVTCRTWLLRHTARFLLYLTPPIVAILVLLPASVWLRIGCVFVGVAGAVVFSFGYTVEGAEARVEKAGYEYGTAERMREQRAGDAQRTSAALRREKIANRRARR